MENNLEIDVKNANKLGLSYGYYKALYHDPNVVPIERPEYSKICPICGNIVKPPMIRLCSKECAQKRKADYERRRRAKC